MSLLLALNIYSGFCARDGTWRQLTKLFCYVACYVTKEQLTPCLAGRLLKLGSFDSFHSLDMPPPCKPRREQSSLLAPRARQNSFALFCARGGTWRQLTKLADSLSGSCPGSAVSQTRHASALQVPTRAKQFARSPRTAKQLRSFLCAGRDVASAH